MQRRNFVFAMGLATITAPLCASAADPLNTDALKNKLDISPSTAAKFIPAVTDFVGKAGGSDLGAKLAGALR